MIIVDYGWAAFQAAEAGPKIDCPSFSWSNAAIACCAGVDVIQLANAVASLKLALGNLAGLVGITPNVRISAGSLSSASVAPPTSSARLGSPAFCASQVARSLSA